MARQRLPWEQAGGSGDVAAALAALDADELRAFIGGTRFPAYQEALRNALGGAGRFVGTRSFADGE
jgi:hypothetical protein